MLRALLHRIRTAADSNTGVALTLHEGLMIDAKFFELEQLVLDHRRLIDFLRVDEKAKERAAVVAWLREHWSEVLEQTPQQTARLIERGDHRREVTE